MAKILDSQTINGKVQRAIETPMGYIFNGHYYDKNTMTPKPFKLFPLPGDLEDLALNQRLLNRYTPFMFGKTFGNSIVTDTYEPGVFYIFPLYARSNGSGVWKFHEDGNDIRIIGAQWWGAVPTSYPYFQQYCGQDKTYVYAIFGTGNNMNTYFCRIHKKNLTLEYPGGWEFSTYSIGTALRDTADYVYFAYQRQFGHTYVKRLVKTSQAIEDCGALVKASNKYLTPRMCDPVKISDASDFTFSLNHDSVANKIYIQKYTFDYSKTVPTQVVSEAAAAIDWSASTTITELPNLPSAAQFLYELFITTNSSGKQYLNVELSNMPGYTDVSEKYGIYTFEITPSRDLIFKGYCKPSSAIFRGAIGIKKNTFLVGTTDASTIFMNFDEAIGYFVVTDIMNNQPFHVGADQAENIWIINGGYEVEMISPFIPTDVKVNLEKASYKYEGADIATYATIEAKNYMGTNVVTNIELTLKGNAVFTGNNSKIIAQATSATGPFMVPITIKGAGSITVYPKMIL